jgi:hypothetical protein
VRPEARRGFILVSLLDVLAPSQGGPIISIIAGELLYTGTSWFETRMQRRRRDRRLLHKNTLPAPINMQARHDPTVRPEFGKPLSPQASPSRSGLVRCMKGVPSEPSLCCRLLFQVEVGHRKPPSRSAFYRDHCPSRDRRGVHVLVQARTQDPVGEDRRCLSGRRPAQRGQIEPLAWIRSYL